MRTLGTTSGTVTFAANSAAGGATQTITITATDDALSETAESFTVTLGDDHLHPIIAGVPQVRRNVQRDGDDIASQRPDHHLAHQRAHHSRMRATRPRQLHRVAVAVRGDSDGRPHRLLRHGRWDRD